MGSEGPFVSQYNHQHNNDQASRFNRSHLDRDLPKIEPPMLRVFDRAEDAALFLPAEQRAGAARKQLQERDISRVDPTFGHEVPGEFLGYYRSPVRPVERRSPMAVIRYLFNPRPRTIETRNTRRPGQRAIIRSGRQRILDDLPY
jgi:hypothetical protein